MQKAERFWQWWQGELASLMPESLRRWWVQGSALMRRVEGQWQITSADNDDELWGEWDGSGARAELHKSPASITLLLPSDMCLQTEVSLPRAALENLRDTLTFEMDRLTPFKLEEVYFDYRLKPVAPEEKQIKLDLVLARRSDLDALVARIEALGLPLVQVSVEALADYRDLDLDPRPAKQRSWQRKRAFEKGLALTGLLLLGAVLLTPVIQKQQQLDALQPRLDAMRAKTDLVRGLREQINSHQTALAFVEQKQRERLRQLPILDEVTRIFPDDSWVQRMEIRGDEVRVQGQSADTGKLVELLAQSSMFTEVQFSAPVVEDRVSGVERFSLQFSYQGGE